jgi:hypothetical protein
VSNNLTVQSPEFERIVKEAGKFTSDAMSTLWYALIDLKRSQRVDTRRAQDLLEPRVIEVNAAASVNDLDLQGCSVVLFTGTTAQNFTGMRAPETGRSRVVLIYVFGSGTITAKQTVTSDTGNQLDNKTAADTAFATRGGAVYCYLSNKWRQVV